MTASTQDFDRIMDGNPRVGAVRMETCVKSGWQLLPMLCGSGNESTFQARTCEMANLPMQFLLRIAALCPWLLFQRIHMPPSIGMRLMHLLITFWNHCLLSLMLRLMPRSKGLASA